MIKSKIAFTLYLYRMKIDVYNFNNSEKKSLTLDKEFFDIALNKDLLYQVTRSQGLNLRKSNAHTKTRGEVRGGGKKPWAQKYLGRARHGSIRSPIWVGGGVAFGPRNDKSYLRKINKKAKNKALFMAISSKLRDNEVVFIDNLSDKETLKTKNFVSNFKNFINLSLKENFNDRKKFLIMTAAANPNLKRACANIKNIQVISAQSVSCLLILSQKYIIVTKDAISELLKRKFKTSSN